MLGPSHTRHPTGMKCNKELVLAIIREMQSELDSFFRARKARKVQLTGDDILYLEVMLAQAVGSGHSKIEDDSFMTEHARRFLTDFFTLKTKPQVQLRASSFALVRLMVERTVAAALRDARSTSSCLETDDDTIIPSSISSTPSSLNISPNDSLVIVQEESPEKHPFNTCTRPAGKDQWLRRDRTKHVWEAPSSTDSESEPEVLQLKTSSPAEIDEKRLPIKKRRASLDQLVPKEESSEGEKTQKPEKPRKSKRTRTKKKPSKQ